MGSDGSPGKMDEKLKSEDTQKEQFSMFTLYFDSNQGKQAYIFRYTSECVVKFSKISSSQAPVTKIQRTFLGGPSFPPPSVPRHPLLLRPCFTYSLPCCSVHNTKQAIAPGAARRYACHAPADGSSTRGGSTSVRGRVRSPHVSGGRRWLSCRQPACL